MSAVAFAQSVLRAIDDHVEALTHRMASGVPADWAAYRAMVGERRGALMARELITDRFSVEERSTFQLGET